RRATPRETPRGRRPPLPRPGPPARGPAGLPRACARHRRTRRHLLPPRDEARATLSYGKFGEHAPHRHAAIGIEIDIGERVVIACDPGSLRELLLHLVDRKEDLLGRMGEIRLAEAGARRAPLLALVGQRDALHQPLEFAALDTARDDADHAVPAVYRDVVHHLFVAEFIPVTHARRA